MVEVRIVFLESILRTDHAEQSDAAIKRIPNIFWLLTVQDTKSIYRIQIVLKRVQSRCKMLIKIDPSKHASARAITDKMRHTALRIY